MKTIPENNKAIDIAIEALKKGGLIIYATETCYGVGVDATNQEAVTKLLEYKNRPAGKAISIACCNKEMAENYVEINEEAEKIYKNFLPGPVTVISNSKGNADNRLCSEKNTLGIRIPDYDFLIQLIQKFGKPITSTSANLSGDKTPYEVEDILNNLSQKREKLVDLIIDAGELPKTLPSTVIDTTTDELKTYRSGNVKVASGQVKETIKTSSVEETINLGEKLMKENLGELKNKALIFLLRGELGAGKTHFTKGVAKALRITQTIKSPTYTYLEEYPIISKSQFLISNVEDPSSINDKEYSSSQKQVARNYLFHLDAWKIENSKDLEILDIKGKIVKGNVIVVEWPDVLYNFIEKEEIFKKAKIINIEINYLGDNQREISVY